VSAVDAVSVAPLQEVPQLLKDIPNWVVWKDGSKAPFIAGTNQHASSVDPDTWRSFDEVKNIATTSTSGVDFVINGTAVEQGLVGFDLDNCRNPEIEE
jgi:putative DNA primase/helicase